MTNPIPTSTHEFRDAIHKLNTKIKETELEVLLLKAERKVYQEVCEQKGWGSFPVSNLLPAPQAPAPEVFDWAIPSKHVDQVGKPTRINVLSPTTMEKLVEDAKQNGKVYVEKPFTSEEYPLSQVLSDPIQQPDTKALSKQLKLLISSIDFSDE